jgi:hypothetical protein
MDAKSVDCGLELPDRVKARKNTAHHKAPATR